jgi:hypothetical protein
MLPNMWHARAVQVSGNTWVCDATRTQPATVFIVSSVPERPFRLCEEAAQRFQNRALRPSEGFNLASIFSAWELDDDTYDEFGTAQSPALPVEVSPETQFPPIRSLLSTPHRLIDLAIAWEVEVFDHTGVDIVGAARRMPQSDLFAAIQDRVAGSPVPLARAPSPDVSAWIRSLWKSATITDLAALTQATVALLPAADAWPLVRPWIEDGCENIPTRLVALGFTRPAVEPTELFRLGQSLLQRLPDNQRSGHAIGLFGPSQTSLALDWIESNVSPPLTREWGHLAALSRLDAPRALCWLSRGRPLSLVGLMRSPFFAASKARDQQVQLWHS